MFLSEDKIPGKGAVRGANFPPPPGAFFLHKYGNFLHVKSV